jgi:hypothetical protein
VVHPDAEKRGHAKSTSDPPTIFVEDRKVELLKAFWVGNQVNGNDLSAPDLNPNTTRGRPCGAHPAPAAPSTSAGCANRARPENVPATATAPLTSFDAPARTAEGSAYSTTSGSSNSRSASKSPPRDAARNASMTCRWRVTSESGAAAPCTRRRARLASCHTATGVRPTIGAISSKGTANMSCSTNATRSQEPTFEYHEQRQTYRVAKERFVLGAVHRGSSTRAGARPRAPHGATCAREACRGTRGRRSSSANLPGSRHRLCRRG